MLEVINVTKYFGGIAALKGLSFVVNEKELVGLIGPNGAGKTTLFNLISGVYRPTQGLIKFDGRNLNNLKPYQICHMGIARTFQIPKPFKRMSVLENVMVGILFGKGKTISLKDARSKALEYINLVGLSGRGENKLAGELNVADLKSLEIARALATNPKLLLLDEVVSGLNPVETKEKMRLVQRIRDELAITVLWIEHVMSAVMGLCERVIVIYYGAKLAEGSPKEIASNSRVIEAYLGKEYTI